ncbi:MAG: hypothetical protein RLZZ339_298 [Cyanobacteriota bacterium]|jgi:hypothetical protein
MKTSTVLKNCSRVAAGTVFVTLGILTTGTAHAAELITNGGFETGFTGWNVSIQPGSNSTSGFFIDDANGSTPFSGQATVGPASGSFYAVSDQGGPGAYALTQTFIVPGAASSVILSYDMFVNDWSGLGPIVNPSGLDYTSIPNQHARVDILVAGANPFSTNPADIVGNFYLGNDPFASNPNPYTSYSFDITSLVGAGGSYILRFAEVDNQFFFNQGVDNVSIDFTPLATPVPEPASVLGLLAIGALGAGAAWKRKLK